MRRGMAYSVAIIAAIFCLHWAMNMGLLQSHGSVPSCASAKHHNTCLSLLAVVDNNVHKPPDISAGSAKELPGSSAGLVDTMPGCASDDGEDLPQIKHAFLKIFHHDPINNFGLSPLSVTLAWSDKSKLRTLRPPVRAAPRA